MNKKAPWIIGLCVVAVAWWLIHTPEVQWYDAKSHLGKKVTVIGPIIRGTLDSSDGVVTMTMGTGLSDNDWESSLHIIVPRKNLSIGWTQKDLAKGAVMRWTGRVQTGVGNSTWLIVEPNTD